MDPATFSNIIAAAGLAYAIAREFYARRSAAVQRQKSAQVAASANDAADKAAKAVDHSKAVVQTAEANQQAIEQVRGDVASAKEQTDVATARYLRVLTLLRLVPKRLDAQDRALLYLADRVGALEAGEPPPPDPYESPEHQAAKPATPELEANGSPTTTGRHRLPTQIITTVREDL